MNATDARTATLLALLLMLQPGVPAVAQTAPPAAAPGKAIPSPDQLEPGVDTTRSAPPAASQALSPAGAPPAAAAGTPKAAGAAPAAAAKAPGEEGPGSAQPRGDGCDG
jgi:hypothetical protein